MSDTVDRSADSENALRQMAWLWTVIRPGLTPTSIGWVTSAVVHVAGGLAAWVMIGAAPTVDPYLPGHIHQVELIATSREPVATDPSDEIPAIDAQVLITPRAARIAGHRFIHSDADVSQPSPAELAIVKRLIALPPPALQRRIAQAEDSDSARDVRPPPPVPRRLPPTPKGAVADASMQRSGAERSPVGTAAEIPPHLLQNVPPTYPAQAVLHRWEGTVLLRLHIAADGRVTNVEMLSSSGHHILDVEAIRSVRHWRFVPGYRDGRAVAATVRLPVQFVLSSDNAFVLD